MKIVQPYFSVMDHIFIKSQPYFSEIVVRHFYHISTINFSDVFMKPILIIIGTLRFSILHLLVLRFPNSPCLHKRVGNLTILHPTRIHPIPSTPNPLIAIPHNCHFLYANAISRSGKGTPKKCVNSRRKLPRDKTA